MRKINIWALCLAVLGILFLLLDGTFFGMSSIFSKTDAGFVAIGIGYPLILIGIIVWVVGLFTKKK
ncbi:MAG: hypothetical protein Q7S74_05705 [Nanoarchaeota archaeon]|nr:hypothetical protein [Nanoarchaeota archaeon]